MNTTIFHKTTLTLAGYAALIMRFRLEVIPNWHESFIADDNRHSIEKYIDTINEVYPNEYQYDNTLGKHLEFAIQYDG
ncbi:MAG: hypothetical protein LBT09_14495, partial [Planctomycetaceae bacterium]|nr:hypothetical protein [Planctomycetaceae bacterium]